MSRRFNDRYFNDETPVAPETFNPIISEFDRAIDALENFRVDWRHQVDLFNANALKRFNDAVQPIVDQIGSAADGGFLVAETDDNVALVVGEEVSFFIPPASRIAFRPTPFLTIMAPDEYEDWAVARKVSYIEDTGLLVVDIMYLHGSGALRSGWTVSASSGIVEAVSQWAVETSVARNTAVEKAAAALASATAAASSAADALTLRNQSQAFAEASARARDASQEHASNAAESASAAAASAASLAGGPVFKVNNRTGEVTGLAEASDVASTFSALYASLASDFGEVDAAIAAIKSSMVSISTVLGTKADQSTTYTKTEVDQIASSIGVVTQFKYAGFF